MDGPGDVSQRAWIELVRGTQGVLHAAERALKQAGHPPLVWYDILRELEWSPDGRLRHRDIHRRMLLERYNVSRIVERMAEARLVRQQPSADDARGTEVLITRAGRDVRRAMWRVYGGVIEERFENRYSATELETLAALLRRLNEDS